jgi:hypothetical protein
VLPSIPIQEERKDFMTDQARLARACHLFVRMVLSDPIRGSFETKPRLDTGAPFSIIPYSLWHGRNLSWSPLGSQFLSLGGRIDPTALTWLGVPCTFGELKVVLRDEADQPSRPLRLIAKLPQAVLPGHMEKVAILGYNFLMDNYITLTVNPTSRTTAGNLANVVGFLTVR